MAQVSAGASLRFKGKSARLNLNGLMADNIRQKVKATETVDEKRWDRR